MSKSSTAQKDVPSYRFSSLLKNKKLLLLLAVLPIIFLGWYLSTRSVNVPFYDDWELTPIIKHIHTDHHLYWGDFWEQHNEHRILFPNIVLITSAFITHWNSQVGVFISFVVAIASFILLMKTLFKIQPIRQSSGLQLAIVTLMLSTIWFSLGQVENWLWEWQVEWFLNVLGVTTVLYGLTEFKKGSIGNRQFTLIIAGAILSQYSLGNGSLLWPLIIVALLYLHTPIKKICVVAGTAIVTTGLYYFHYVNPAGPSKSLAIKQPVEFLKYFFAYLGRPLTYHHRPAMIIGFLIFLSFISFCTYLLLKKEEQFRKSVPFVLLGLYATGSGFITGLARLGFGLNEAYSSRYTTISSLFTVSMISLCYINRAILQDIFGRYFKNFAVLVCVGVYVLLIMNASQGKTLGDAHSQYLTDIKHCSSLQHPSQICLLSAYPSVKTISPRLEYLKQIHWAGY